MPASIRPAIALVLCLGSMALADGRVSVPKTSVYRDGVWNNGAGSVYVYYYNQPNDNPFYELRNTAYNLAQTKTNYNNGTIGLKTYAGVNYAGANANNMQDHTTNYGWNANFSVTCAATVKVDVHLNFDWSGSGLTAQQQTTTRNGWESDIEGWWSNRYAINDGTVNHPIIFDVRFDAYAAGAQYDQTITVLAGNGRADLTHWYAQSSGAVEAHEFGHAIGAFDEYWSGALNSATLTTDYTSLMGSVSNFASGEGLRGRYFNDILDVYNAKGGAGPNTIVLIPGPGGLAGLGVGALLAIRRRRRC